MYIYFIAILFILFFFSFFRKRTALRLSFLLLALIAALRSINVGIDTEQFCTTYKDIGLSDWTFRSLRYEYLYCVVVKLMNYITPNYQILIVTTSLFINFAFYKFIKNNLKDYRLAVLLYIFMNIFFSNMNIMREAIAISIVLLSFGFLKKQRYFLFTIFGVISIFFHVSGVISLGILVIYLLSKFKRTSFILAIVGIVGFALSTPLYTLLSSLLGKNYIAYLDSSFGLGWNIGAILEFLLYSLTFLFLIYAIYGVFPESIEFEEGNDRINLFYKNMMIISLIALALVITINIFNRFSSFLMPFVLLIVCKLIEIYRSKKGNVGLNITRLLVFTFAAYWLVVSIFRPEWAGCSNYQFFWQVK